MCSMKLPRISDVFGAGVIAVNSFSGGFYFLKLKYMHGISVVGGWKSKRCKNMDWLLKIYLASSQ